jgi:hypothetical protein
MIEKIIKTPTIKNSDITLLAARLRLDLSILPLARCPPAFVMLFLDTKLSKPGYRSFRPFIGFRVLIMPPPLMVILNIDMCKPNIDTGISARSAM